MSAGVSRPGASSGQARFLRTAESALFFATLCGVIALAALHLFNGYADNCDFPRSVGFLLERPQGFTAMWPSPGTEEWPRRFFSVWHDRWVFLPDWPDTGRLFSSSSYKLYLLLQAWLLALSGFASTGYSIVAASLLSRLILLATYASLAIQLRRQGLRAAAWLCAVLWGMVLIDAGWMAYLNSFYEEQLAVILLPLLGVLLFRYLQVGTTPWALALLFCATLIATAKTATFYLPLLIGLLLLWRARSRTTLLRLLLVTLVLQGISTLPVVFGHFKDINAYHAVYFGALKALPREKALAVQSIGEKPVVHECIGVPAFAPEGDRCVETARSGYVDVVRLVAEEPGLGIEMVRVLWEGAQTIRLDYLGQSLTNAPDFSRSAVFNVWPRLFRSGYPALSLLMLSLTVGLLVFRTSRLSDIERAMLMTGGVFLVFGFSQYGVALGDGYFELTKHLMTGNYALALAAPLVLGAVLNRLMRVVVDPKNAR